MIGEFGSRGWFKIYPYNCLTCFTDLVTNFTKTLGSAKSSALPWRYLDENQKIEIFTLALTFLKQGGGFLTQKLLHGLFPFSKTVGSFKNPDISLTYGSNPAFGFRTRYLAKFWAASRKPLVSISPHPGARIFSLSEVRFVKYGPTSHVHGLVSLLRLRGKVME